MPRKIKDRRRYCVRWRCAQRRTGANCFHGQVTYLCVTSNTQNKHEDSEFLVQNDVFKITQTPNGFQGCKSHALHMQYSLLHMQYSLCWRKSLHIKIWQCENESSSFKSQ